jgi:hypothetical protein
MIDRRGAVIYIRSYAASNSTAGNLADPDLGHAVLT